MRRKATVTVGAGTVTVTGHSLGSALATYLTLDVAVGLGDRATACLFASPRTGDAAWVELFDSKSRITKSTIIFSTS